MATHEPSKVIEVTIPFLGQLKTEDRNTLKNVLERKVALKNEDMNELTKSIKLCISVEDPLLFECAICYLKRMTEFYLGLKEIDPKLKIEEWQLSKIPKTTRLLFDLVYEALTSFKPESLHDGFQTALCNFVITCRAYPRSKMDGLHMLELLPYDQYKEMVPFSHFIWLMTEGIRHRVPTGPQEMDVSALRPTLNRYKEVVLRIMNAFDEHGVEHRPTFMNICRVNLLTVVLEPHEFLPYYIHYATLLPSTNPSPLMNETIEYLGLILPIIDSAMNQPNIAHIILKVVLMLNAYENPSTRQMKNVYINRFLKLEARDPSLDIQYCIMEKLPSDLLSSDEVFISLCEITRRASEYQSYEYVSYALSLFKYWTSKKKFKPKQIIQLFNAFIGFQVKVDHGNIVRGGIRLADEISMALPELLNELEPAEKREFWSELIESIFSRGDTSNISRIGLISLCLKGASECFRGEHRPKFLSHVETLVEKVLQIPEFPPHSVFSIFICIQNVISLKDLTTEEKDATLQITTMLRSMLATYNTTHPGGAKLLEQLDWTN